MSEGGTLTSTSGSIVEITLRRKSLKTQMILCGWGRTHLNRQEPHTCALVSLTGRSTGTRDRKLALELLYSQPEYGRRLSLCALPLVNDSLAGRAHLLGQLMLTEAETAPKSHESGRVVRG